MRTFQETLLCNIKQGQDERRTGALLDKVCLVGLNAFCRHLADSPKKMLRRYRIELVIVRVMASLLLPWYVCICKKERPDQALL